MTKKSGQVPKQKVPDAPYPEDPILAREQARRLALNPVFRTFVNRTRDRLTERWKNATDTLARESIWYKMQGLNELMLTLAIAVNSGTQAEHTAKRAEMNQKLKELSEAVESRGTAAPEV